MLALPLLVRQARESADAPSKYANPTTKFGDGFFPAREDARVTREVAISLALDDGREDARV